MTGNDTGSGTGRGGPDADGAREACQTLHPGESVGLSIFRELPDGLVLIDGEGRCRYLNPAFTRITGYFPGDFPTLEAWFERAHPNPAYRRNVQDTMQRLLRGDQSILVASVVCRSGKVRDIEFRHAPLPAGCALLVIRDVTERVLVEEHLRQATSELTAVIEAFPDLFLRLNADGTILDSRAGRLAEVPLVSRALLGRRLQELLPAEVGVILGKAMQEAARTNVPAAPMEFSCAGAGKVRHYETRIMPLRELHLLAVIREITDRKEAEEELHRHREHLEDLIAERTVELERANQRLEHLLYCIEVTERRAATDWLDSSIGQGAPGTAEPDAGRITTDADGIIVIVDGTAERLTGYAGSKLAGRTVWDVLVGDAREALTVGVLGEARSVECAQGAAIVRTDGSQFPVHLLGDAIVDAGGAVIGMVCTFWKV